MSNLAEPTQQSEEMTVLSTLQQISQQQAVISQLLRELLETLNKPAETSLVDELQKLLQPLASDLSEIKRRLPSGSAQTH